MLKHLFGGEPDDFAKSIHSVMKVAGAEGIRHLRNYAKKHKNERLLFEILKATPSSDTTLQILQF